MRKWFSTVVAFFSSLCALCAFMLLALALCIIAGCTTANESKGGEIPEPSESPEPLVVGSENPIINAESLWLPIRENLIAVGANDFYAIRAGGTLSMWGSQDGGPISETIPFENAINLKDHAVAVYASPRSAVFVIDEGGALWTINTARFDGLVAGAEFDMENAPMKPVKVMDNISMAAIGQFHSLILRRDGTLWVQGFGWFGAPWIGEQKSYLIQVMDNVIWADVTAYGGYAVTSNHELWSWGLVNDGEQPKKVLDGVLQVSSSNLVLTENGELLSLEYDYGTNAFSTPKKLLSNVIQCNSDLGITQDGYLWICGTGIQPPQKVDDNVAHAAQGEQAVLALHCDNSLWVMSNVADNSTFQKTRLS